MSSRKITFCITSLAVLVLILAACNRISTSDTPEATEASPLSLTSPTSAPIDTPTPVPTSSKGYITSFDDSDCLMSIHGELGEITTVFQAEASNEPRINIDRVFQRFHQGETPSTILRCDMNSGGFFSTWWMQSLEDEEAAIQLFDGFVEATEIAVDEYDLNIFACAGVSGEMDDSGEQYKLSFFDRGICTGAVFDGVSGLIRIGNNVVGIDAKFHSEFFDLIDAHARSIIERRSAN